MPLAAYALGVYVAGLLAGFADSLLFVAVVIAAGIAVGWSRGHVVVIAFAALATTGVVAARTSQRDEAQCARDGLRRDPLLVVVEDSVFPGAYLRGRLAGCQATVSVAVETGNAEAGSVVAVHGDVGPSKRGLLVQQASVKAIHPPRALRRMRSASSRAIDRIFRTDAPLVRALLIADRHDLSREVQDRFASAGLAHILSISGMHIAIIAVALRLCLELVGVARQRADVASVIVVVFYVALIGAPTPAVRSAAMLAALFVSRAAQRHTSGWSILTLGAAQPVFDPRVALDLGYQLTVIGVAAIIAAGQLINRLGVERLPQPSGTVLASVIGATVATIASAPLVAWVFGRVSVAAPLTNLAAGPLITLAQPMLFCGMVLAPIPAVATLFADAAHPLLNGLDRVASVGAAIPHGSIQVAPTLFAAIVAGVMSASVIALCASRDWIQPAILAAASALVLVWLPLAPSRSGMTELHMIDVGQGDAVALRTPHGHWVLFDAGGAWRGGDAGKSTVIPYLGRRGGSLDMFVLSHPHTDHVGGAANVLRALRPRTYVDAGFPGGASSYRESLAAARDTRVRWVRAHPGDSVNVDGVVLTFLAPDSVWTASLTDPNLASVVTLVRAGEVRMLIMGDAEEPEERWLLQHEAELLRADILKVGHHGSKTSSSGPFLDAVQPRLALVSVGAGNTYHLPTPSVMRALAAHGAQVLRTDLLGTIVARTDGHRVIVDAAGDSWELPPPFVPSHRP
jgi:competence protein ComEC